MEARMTHAWRRGFTALPVRAASAESPGTPTAEPDALSETELALVRRVCAGDEAAFEGIFRAYYARLVSFACTNLGSQALAEEMVQEVFLQIWMRRERWVVERSLAAYLFRCVRNRILNARRSLRLESAYAADLGWQTEADPSASSDEQLHEAEIGAALAHAIAMLPGRPRQVFLLSRRQGLSYAEIADVLGIALKTVEMQMARALAQLRISLGDWRRS
jgi:RNA polymerase sigma-70 factor (ECF subfamily)